MSAKARRNPQVEPQDEESIGEVHDLTLDDAMKELNVLENENRALRTKLEECRMECQMFKTESVRLKELCDKKQLEIQNIMNRQTVGGFKTTHKAASLFPTWRRHQASALLAQWKSM